MLPVPRLSPCGHDAPVETAPIEEAGVVYSWTRIHQGEAVDVMVMADFFNGGLRVSAPLLEADAIQIGDRVALVMSSDSPYAFVLAR